MKNLKNALLGISVAAITFLYWLLIMVFGDEYRRAHHEYWNEITLFFIISAIIVNIFLIYLFYNRVNLKDKLALFFIASPFLLVLIVTAIVSQNVPRLLDIVCIGFGSVLIYAISKNQTETNQKAILILASYFLVIAVSYPFLFNLLESNFSRI